ncbi:MAG: hypothetical protein AAF840_04955 [Bacteroidota bacterium]
MPDMLLLIFAAVRGGLAPGACICSSYLLLLLPSTTWRRQLLLLSISREAKATRAGWVNNFYGNGRGGDHNPTGENVTCVDGVDAISKTESGRTVNLRTSWFVR